MSECFSEIGEEIQGAIPAINCAQRRESYRLTSVADTLNTKGLKQLTGKSTSSNIGANISTQLNAVIPVDPAPSYQMTRSEEHTSELQSLMRISYAVFCLHKKQTHKKSK